MNKQEALKQIEEQRDMILDLPELIEDEDIIFNKDSEYHKQKKKEKKNPIFKRNKPKNRWAL